MVVQKRGILLGFLLQAPVAVDGIAMVTLNSKALTLGIQGILYLCIFVLVVMEKRSYYICMTNTCVGHSRFSLWLECTFNLLSDRFNKINTTWRLVVCFPVIHICFKPAASFHRLCVTSNMNGRTGSVGFCTRGC